MKNYAILIGTLALLGGCVSEEQIAQSDDAQCASYGARQGTDQYTQCRMLIAQDRAQRRSAALIAFGSAMQAQAAQMQAQQQAIAPPPLPTTTNCYKVGNTVSCQTY